MGPASGDKGVSDDVSPHDRIGLPVGAEADECYGVISITPVVASWHEPRNCFRVGRGTGRAIAMPRTRSHHPSHRGDRFDSSCPLARGHRDGHIPKVRRELEHFGPRANGGSRSAVGS